MARNVRLNSRGVLEQLKSAEVRREVNKLAEEIARIAKMNGPLVQGVPGDVVLPVKVEEMTTDRARAAVVIAHPSGLAVQAKHGLLTRAAAQAGVEVKSRSDASS